MFSRIFLTIALFLTATNPSFAKTKQDFLTQNKADLTQIENYLNNIKFLDASFRQESEGGQTSNGRFLLSRPGKMRVEYDKSTPILIIANGSVLAYTDLELEETSYLSTNSTPASFLTRSNFSFSATDVEITDFKKADNFIEVGITKKNKKEAGIFRLVFRANPLEFVRMEVKNDLDETTKVQFTSTRFGEKIDDKIFVVKNKNLPQ